MRKANKYGGKKQDKKLRMKRSNCIVNLLFYLCLISLFLFSLQLLAFVSFKIPSDSMEPALLPGDYIIVDKCSKGARLFDIVASLKGENVNIHRMPGWRDFHRNDVIVFNFPFPKKNGEIAFDVMQYYVKRCIALPGDTLEIRDSHYKVRGCTAILGNLEAQDCLQELFAMDEVQKRNIAMRSYPKHPLFNWTINEFGPLYIPASGTEIAMDLRNQVLYKRAIEWEQKKKLTVRGDIILLGDSAIQYYRFRENYYFMAGDNAYNSQDSRYWGLLPEPFIVGRAVRIWKSVDRNTGKVRRERIWKKIE